MTGPIFIHRSAEVEPDVIIGDGTKVWRFTHISKGAVIGKNCVIGQGVFIGKDVVVGDGCKVQNGSQIFAGVTLGDSVFVGPGVIFTNVLFPRADMEQKDYVKTEVGDGASIGAGVVIICGNNIGKRAFIAAGSVVVKPVYNLGVVIGNPGRIVGKVPNDKSVHIHYNIV